MEKFLGNQTKKARRINGSTFQKVFSFFVVPICLFDLDEVIRNNRGMIF